MWKQTEAEADLNWQLSKNFIRLSIVIVFLIFCPKH